MPARRRPASDRTIAAGRARRAGTRCRACRARRRAASDRPWRRKRSIVALGVCPPNSPATACAVRYSAWVIVDRRAESRREPRGVAEMVGMVVRRDDSPDRHRCERRLEVALPQRAGGEIAEPAIDERGAVGFPEHPQVDVVQRERQRHPQPQDARARSRSRRPAPAARRRDRARLREAPASAGRRILCTAASSGKPPRVSSRYAIVTGLALCAFRALLRSMPAVNAPGGHAKPTAAERTVPTYSISELAQEFALTTRAIRFYEDEGLLTPRRRGLARIYGERERTRIKLILRGKRLGLTLSEIRELFDIYATAGNERAQLDQIPADARGQARDAPPAAGGHRCRAGRDCLHRKRLPPPPETGSGVRLGNACRRGSLRLGVH